MEVSNDVWGADSTAHHASRTLNSEEGWVIAKSKLLEQLLIDTFESIGLGREEYYELRIELCHNIVETAGDILIKRINAIGEDYSDLIKRAENE